VPVCSTGSELAPGNPSVIRIDPLYAASLLPPGWAWLLQYIPFLEPFTLDMGEFCSLEPPADPGLDVSDLFNLISGNKYDLGKIARAKLVQLVWILVWYRYCRCINLAPPTPYTDPTPPADLPVVNPPNVVSPGGGGTPCLSITRDFLLTNPSGALSDSVAVQWPAGAHHVRMSVSGVTDDWAPLLSVISCPTSTPALTAYVGRWTQSIHNGLMYYATTGAS